MWIKEVILNRLPGVWGNETAREVCAHVHARVRGGDGCVKRSAEIAKVRVILKKKKPELKGASGWRLGGRSCEIWHVWDTDAAFGSAGCRNCFRRACGWRKMKVPATFRTEERSLFSFFFFSPAVLCWQMQIAILNDINGLDQLQLGGNYLRNKQGNTDCLISNEIGKQTND